MSIQYRNVLGSMDRSEQGQITTQQTLTMILTTSLGCSLSTQRPWTEQPARRDEKGQGEGTRSREQERHGRSGHNRITHACKFGPGYFRDIYTCTTQHARCTHPAETGGHHEPESLAPRQRAHAIVNIDGPLQREGEGEESSAAQVEHFHPISF